MNNTTRTRETFQRFFERHKKAIINKRISIINYILSILTILIAVFGFLAKIPFVNIQIVDFSLESSTIIGIIGVILFSLLDISARNDEGFESLVFQKYFSEEGAIISEHKNGFLNISDSFNTKKPLKILFTNMRLEQLPYSIQSNLKNFSEVQIALDFTEKTAKSRAISLNREDYYEDGLNKGEVLFSNLRHRNSTNTKIYIINKDVFPLGLMIQNDKTIYFAPLWNHANHEGGAAIDYYLKIPVNSGIGKLMMNSFDNLIASGNSIDIFDPNHKNIDYKKIIG